MAKIKFEGQEVMTHPDETVLESFLREGVDLPHGCRQGGCYSCVVYSVNVTPPKEAQEGLDEDDIEKNGFFACLCEPEQDMTISLEAVS